MKTETRYTVGQMVDPKDLPAHIARDGGGWFRSSAGDQYVYVCTGCQRDGQYGFQVKEIKVIYR